VSAASGGFPLQIIINSTFGTGRDTRLLKQHKLCGADAWAKAKVIDDLIEEVQAVWPYVVYSDQIRQVVHNVVREICSDKNKTK
jgi:hypothetical protein